MRWYIEIAPVGKGPPVQKLCLEASHWQPALQQARKLRGEDDKLGGLSVEFRDNGCSAIDAALRLKYEVHKAPDDAPIDEGRGRGGEDDEGSSPDRPSRDRKSRRGRRRKLKRRLEAAAEAPAPASSRRKLKKTLMMGTAPAASQPPTPPVAAELRATSDAPPGTVVPPDPEAPPPPSASKPPSEAPAPSAGRPDRKRKGTVVGLGLAEAAGPDLRCAVVAERSSEPTEARPIAYRERAYGLQERISLRDVGPYLIARLAEAKLELSAVRAAGRLVRLALYDQAFVGEPKRPPIATLEWKDWRDGAPTPVFFPFSSAATTSLPKALEVLTALGDDMLDPAAPPALPAMQPAPEPVEPAPDPTRPKLSQRADDAEELPPSRPVGVVPMVEVLPSKEAAPAPADAVDEPPPEPEASKPEVPDGERSARQQQRVEPKAPAPTDAAADPEEKPAPPAVEEKPVAPAAEEKPVPPAAEDNPVSPAEPKESKADGAKAEPKAERAGVKAKGAKTSRRSLAARKAGKTQVLGSVPPEPAADRGSEPSRKSRRSVTDARRDSKPVRASQPQVEKRTVKLGTAEARRISTPPSTPDEPLTRAERDQRLAAARELARELEPPASMPGRRIGGDQLIADLFEAMSELFYLNDALEGAEFVLSLAMTKLPSEVGVVSLYDIDKREFVVVHQTGGNKSGLLLRAAESAEPQRTAMRSSRAVVVADAAKSGLTDGRWKDMGVEARSLICAPVATGGRYLGLLELCNPLDGKAFHESDGHALTYIGQQFGQYLNERGVSVDPQAVLAQAQAR